MSDEVSSVTWPWRRDGRSKETQEILELSRENRRLLQELLNAVREGVAKVEYGTDQIEKGGPPDARST